MVTKSITLTQNAENVLNRIIKKDPNFNFSGWIQDRLLNDDTLLVKTKDTFLMIATSSR